MSKTNELRIVVRDVIVAATDLSAVYYERADAAALYPHITFAFDRVDINDFARNDYSITVDIWDKGDDATQVEALADAVADAFNNNNAPQSTILPTFFLEYRRTVLDEDKTIRHKQIQLVAQNYEV